jgi:hypothetical protein
MSEDRSGEVAALLARSELLSNGLPESELEIVERRCSINDLLTVQRAGHDVWAWGLSIGAHGITETDLTEAVQANPDGLFAYASCRGSGLDHATIMATAGADWDDLAICERQRTAVTA